MVSSLLNRLQMSIWASSQIGSITRELGLNRGKTLWLVGLGIMIGVVFALRVPLLVS